MEDNGLKGNLKQPDNFTTCGKLNLEIKQYNNPKEVICIKQIYIFTSQTTLSMPNNLIMEGFVITFEKNVIEHFYP